MLTVRGLGVVLGDLAALGYDARWGVLGACDAGAPHKRDRIWIVAQSSGTGARNHGEETNHGNGGTSRECLQALRQDHRAIGTDRVDTASAGEDAADAKGRESGEQTAGDGREGAGRRGQEVAEAGGKRLQGRKQREALQGDGDGPQAHGPAPERRCSWWDQDPADVADAECGGCGQDREQRGVATMGERGENDAVQAKESDMGKPDAADVGNSSVVLGNGGDHQP